MYGIIVTLGIFSAASFVERIVRRESGSGKADHVWGSLFWSLLLGIVGARLYHVVDLWEYYSQNPNLILAVWTGGMGIFGGIFGGFLGFHLYLKKNKLNTWKWLDYLSLGLPLGQSIGRWGNFFNQELYGTPSNLPWSIFIEEGKRLFPVKAFETFHPLFLYESLGSLFLWGVIVFLYRRKKDISLFGVYLIGYGVLRFLLEPLRIEPWRIDGINVAQAFSVVFILIGLWLIKRKKQS